MDQPSLHVMAADLVPLGAPGALDRVSGSKPRHRLNIGPHRLRRLALGRQVQPERSDLRCERPGIQELDPPGTRLRDGHRFSLFLRFRYSELIRA